jgi:excisionase family DNA binding protein
MPPRSTRPLASVPRYTLTRREAAAALGISINHFERKVQPELKVVLSGQLILIPVAELERWVERHAHQLTQVRGMDEDSNVG